MFIPVWLLFYILVGDAIYWPLQTFMPHPGAGVIALVVTVGVWFLYRRQRRNAFYTELARRQLEAEAQQSAPPQTEA